MSKEPRNADAETAVNSGRISTVIFDCGQVITNSQNQQIARAMAELLGIDWADFPKAYTSVRGEYDRGTLSAQRYWSMVAAPYGKSVDEGLVKKLAVLDMDSWFSINQATVEAILSLKASGYRLLMLSNMNWEGKERMFGPARIAGGKDWIEPFDEILLSCDLGLIKPEPEIYRICLEKAQARAQDCLFIDDMPANVAAARSMGMQTILYSPDKALASILSNEFGLRLEGKGSDTPAHNAMHAGRLG